jgi:hypothetical protein
MSRRFAKFGRISKRKDHGFFKEFIDEIKESILEISGSSDL